MVQKIRPRVPCQGSIIRKPLFVLLPSWAKWTLCPSIIKHPDILAIADRAAIHHMLFRKVYTYEKALTARPLVKRLIGEGIIWAEGEQHKRFRRLTENIFSTASIKSMTPDVLDVSSRHQSRLAQYLQNNSGEAVINMKAWTSAATLGIVGIVMSPMLNLDHVFRV